MGWTYLERYDQRWLKIDGTVSIVWPGGMARLGAVMLHRRWE